MAQRKKVGLLSVFILVFKKNTKPAVHQQKNKQKIFSEDGMKNALA